MNTRILTVLALAIAMGRAASGSPDRKANTADVGIWYCTYYHTKPTDIWDQPYGSSIVKYRPLCSAKKDDFRKYDADDPAVIDFHLEEIAKAKIDFLPAL